MELVALLFALLLPYAIGDALLAACVADGRAWRQPGLVPWLAGAAWIVGSFALTLVMRANAMAGVPFSLPSIGAPGLAIVAAAGFFAWRRSRDGWRDGLRDAIGGLMARDLSRAARVAWFILLAWLALRAAMLLVEVVSKPIYPWDAWSAWATKAKAYFAARTIVPFGDEATWTAATAATWFDAAPGQPATLPLLQAWIATAIGSFDDARVTLPWWLTFVAMMLVVYGETRRRGVAPLPALAAAWFAGSMPLTGAQVALAGYADLPIAAAFALGALLVGMRRGKKRDEDAALGLRSPHRRGGEGALPRRLAAFVGPIHVRGAERWQVDGGAEAARRSQRRHARRGRPALRRG